MSNPPITPPRKPRRWLSFSLRTFLIVVVALSFGLGWIANLLIRVRQQRAVVAQIEAAGGSIRYEHSFSYNQKPSGQAPGPYVVRYYVGNDAYAYVSSVEFQMTKPTPTPFDSARFDTAVNHLARLPRLEGVRFDGIPVGNKHLALVAKLPQLKTLNLKPTNDLTDLSDLQPAAARLRHLSLSGSFADGRAFETLPELTRLETLGLAGPRITAAGMRRLARSRRLKFLGLMNCGSIDDGAFEAIRAHPGLEQLTMVQTSLSAQNLRELAQLPALRTLSITAPTSFQMDAGTRLTSWRHLEELAVESPSFTDQHAAELAACGRLHSLNLRLTSVTDAAIPGLARLTELRTLDLTGTRVTGAGLRQLRALPNLSHVKVSSVVTEADAAELQKHLPNCGVLIHHARGVKTFIWPQNLLNPNLPPDSRP